MRKYLYILVALALSLPLHAQNLTVKFDNCTVEKAMELLKGQGVSFILKSDYVDLDTRVSASFENASLEDIIKKIFQGQNVSWEVNDKAVVISNKPQNVENTRKSSTQQYATGRILDAKGDSVIGASIFIQGSKTGTVSDVDGHFSIPVSKESFLNVTCIGYTGQIVQVKPGMDYLIVLEEDSEFLDEVVVVGFGSQKKVNLTGSVATVSNKDIVQRPVQNATQALQGLVAG